MPRGAEVVHRELEQPVQHVALVVVDDVARPSIQCVTSGSWRQPRPAQR